MTEHRSACSDPTCPGWALFHQPYSIQRCDECYAAGVTGIAADDMAELAAARALLAWSSGKESPVPSPQEAELILGAILESDTGPGVLMRAIREHKPEATS